MPPPPPLSSSETHNNSNRGTWYPYTNSSHFDTNMAVILVILFCALLCALALNLSIRCLLRPLLRRNNTEQQQQPDPEKPNSQPRLSPPSPPTLIYSSGVKLAGAEADCAICLSEFVNGEELRVLPRCQHGFHVKCIQGWLSSHSSCPTCRSSSLITSPKISCVEEGENGTEFDVESQSQSQPPQVPLQQIGLGSSGSE